MERIVAVAVGALLAAASETASQREASAPLVPVAQHVAAGALSGIYLDDRSGGEFALEQNVLPGSFWAELERVLQARLLGLGLQKGAATTLPRIDFVVDAVSVPPQRSVLDRPRSTLVSCTRLELTELVAPRRASARAVEAVTWRAKPRCGTGGEGFIEQSMTAQLQELERSGYANQIHVGSPAPSASPAPGASPRANCSGPAR